jgi:putative addiction module component (TIGR02574 family)
MRAEDILPRALELSRDERNRLAALLLESVEASEDEGNVEEAWTDEITRRLDDHEQGTTRAIPAATVFAEARNRVKRARG